MTVERMASHDKLSPAHWPPLEVLLHDPKKDGLIPTPVDERGLVNPKELIKTVKATATPDYTWTSLFNDIHHLQWPASHYAYDVEADPNPREFRELAVNKIYVPRVFHNWTHRITEPPPAPEEEVMRYHIEAQRVALSLFRAIKAGKNLTRQKGISDELLERGLVRHFDDFTTNLAAARSLPPEFQLIDLTDYEPQGYEDMYALGAQLGRLATAASFVRDVTKPSMA